MQHREIRAKVADFVAGQLDAVTSRRLERHLETCAECRRSFDDYALLADALGTPFPAELDEHPIAEDLAAHVLDTAGASANRVAEIEAHLEICSECRLEVELTRRALAGAHGEAAAESATAETPAAHRSPSRSAGGLRTHRGLAVAASVMLTALAAGALWVSLGSEPEIERRLVGGNLDGVQIIESNSSLLAADIEVRPSADVTLRANDAVALGDGFSVGAGATFIIEIADPAHGI